MSSLRNNNMTAAWQILRHFLSSLRWCDRVHFTREYQHRNGRRDRIVITGWYLSLRPQTTRAALLKDTVIREGVVLIQFRRLCLIDKRCVFRAGDGKIHPICDEV